MIQVKNFFRSLFFLFLILSISHSYAQEWEWGIFAREHTFWSYNPHDFDPNHHYLRVESSNLSEPDGFAIGAVFIYYFRENMGVSVQPEYNWQRQKFKICDGIDCLGLDGLEDYTYKGQWAYISMPLQYVFLLNASSRFQWYVKGGVQVSYLLNYEDVSFINDSVWDYQTVISRNNRNRVYKGADRELISDLEIDWLYRKWTFGAVFGLGWNFISRSENWKLHLGLSGSYDFTDAENKNAKLYYDGQAYPYWTDARWRGVVGVDLGLPDSRLPTRNIRLGLELGFSMLLGY